MRFTSGYVNPGPWRLPIHQYAVFDYCRKFGVVMQPFITKTNSAYLHNSQAYDGKSQPIGDVETVIRGHTCEPLAKSVQQGALRERLSVEDQKKLLEGLRGWGVLDTDYRDVTSGALCDRPVWDVLPGGDSMTEKSLTARWNLPPCGPWACGRSLVCTFHKYGHASAMFEPVRGMGKISDDVTEARRCTRRRVRTATWKTPEAPSARVHIPRWQAMPKRSRNITSWLCV